jgi:structural maintenance of chromosome 2
VRSRLSQLDFTYTPLLGFDTRKVKGLVASLLALKPEDYGKSTALEIAAGGKLYNVVVGDQRTSARNSSNGAGSRKALRSSRRIKIRAFKITTEAVPPPPMIMCQVLPAY